MRPPLLGDPGFALHRADRALAANVITRDEHRQLLRLDAFVARARSRHGLHAVSTRPDELAGDRLRFVSVEAFAAKSEPSAVSLLGDADDAVLTAGSTIVAYGDGGAGKTTLCLDACFHLAAGCAWLGFEVRQPLRVAIVENEGPRGPFRAKLGRKLATWEGPSLAGRLHVLEAPWAALSLRDETHLLALREWIEASGVDLVVLGPVAGIGFDGAGTPDEIEDHARRLAALRQGLSRPLAVWLVHHENKAGDVAGAWERLPDVLLHVRAGERETYLHWRKARWAPRTHGTRMVLRWLADCEGFELLDADATAAKRQAEREEATAWLREYVAAHPGEARSKVEAAYADGRPRGARTRIREAIDAALECSPFAAGGDDGNGEHFSLRTGPGAVANGRYLYPASEVSSPLAIDETASTASRSSALPDGSARRSPFPLRERRSTASSEQGSEEPPADLAPEQVTSFANAAHARDVTQ